MNRHIHESDSAISVVFFDAAGTLFTTRGSVGEIYSRIALRFGIEAEAEELQNGFARRFLKQPPLAFARHTPPDELHRLEKEWWRALVSEVMADHTASPRFAEFFDELYEFFRGGKAWKLFADTAPTLAALKSRGLTLAVISNFDSRLDDVLRALGIDHYFDAIHLSTRLGAAKPDPAIFRAALDYHKVEAGHALHVGDSWREDIEGAVAAGLRAVWLDYSQSQAGESETAHLTRPGQLLELI
jgi:putative hydrolase of the HAD superfamily